MEWRITREWLEKRAALEEGVEASTGGKKFEQLAKEANALRQSPIEQKCFSMAFGTLIYFLRQQRGWSLSLLARKADVDEKDLAKIESEVECTPEPRTVLQLAKALDLPKRKMLELAGLIVTRDLTLRDNAVRFAARGKSLEKLTSEHQEALNEFVKYLANQK